MFCWKCGEMMADNAKFCPVCGAPQQAKQQNAAPAVNPRNDSYQSTAADKGKVGFMEAVKLFFKNYTNFSGRSRRSEYWWFCLFNMIVSFLLNLILSDIAGLWTLVILVPTLSLVVRRLHDIGKSGWWYLIALIPLVGGLILLVWFCKDSDPQTNQWGPSPKC